MNCVMERIMPDDTTQTITNEELEQLIAHVLKETDMMTGVLIGCALLFFACCCIYSSLATISYCRKKTQYTEDDMEKDPYDEDNLTDNLNA